MRPASERPRFPIPVIHLIIIISVGFFVYSNTLQSPFHFDDGLYIVNNPLIKDLSYFKNPSSADSLNLQKVVSRYLRTRYIPYLGFWANYQLGGLNVSGYHVFNLSIHLINASLVYILVILTFKTPFLENSTLRDSAGRIALASGLLFAVHPVQTESVTYITQRFGLLASMFYLIAIISYIGSRLSARRGRAFGLYALSIIFTVCSMFSKETAFTLPMAILLYEVMFFRAAAGKRLALLAPFLITMPIIPLMYEGEGIAVASRLQTDMPRLDYLYTEFTVIVNYIRLILLPINQNLNYDYPVYTSLVDPCVFSSLLILLFVFALGLFLVYRSKSAPEFRLVSFGIFWFFLTLSVESSVIPISELIFEYRLYLPGIGAFIAIASGAAAFLKKCERPKKIATLSFFVFILIMFSYAAYARNQLWESDISLWEDTVKKSPFKVRAHVNLGTAYADAGLSEKAVREYETALSLSPDADIYNNIGLLYEERGNIDKAIEYYEESIKHKPDYVEALNNLGIAYEKKGRIEEAIAHYREAIRIAPYFSDAYYNLGIALTKKGLFDEAIGHFKSAISLRPEDADAHYNLALAYLKTGRPDLAEGEFKVIIELAPGKKQAEENRNRLLNNSR